MCFFSLILQHFEILTDIYINGCTQTTIRFLQRNTKLHSCTQAVIRFLQRNTKFKVVLIRSLTMKYESFEVVPNCLFAF